MNRFCEWNFWTTLILLIDLLYPQPYALHEYIFIFMCAYKSNIPLPMLWHSKFSSFRKTPSNRVPKIVSFYLCLLTVAYPYVREGASSNITLLVNDTTQWQWQYRKQTTQLVTQSVNKNTEQCYFCESYKTFYFVIIHDVCVCVCVCVHFKWNRESHESNLDLNAEWKLFLMYRMKKRIHSFLPLICEWHAVKGKTASVQWRTAPRV